MIRRAWRSRGSELQQRIDITNVIEASSLDVVLRKGAIDKFSERAFRHQIDKWFSDEMIKAYAMPLRKLVLTGTNRNKRILRKWDDL